MILIVFDVLLEKNSDIVDFGKLKLVVDFVVAFVEKRCMRDGRYVIKKRLNVF
jgi:hypothetical protein